MLNILTIVLFNNLSNMILSKSQINENFKNNIITLDNIYHFNCNLRIANG